MYRNLSLLGAAGLCLLAVACSKTSAPTNQSQVSQLKQEVKAELDRRAAAAVIPSELDAAGVAVENSAIALKPAASGGGNELEITGTLTNHSNKSVDGVNLVITFQNEQGQTLGGHTTQQYFEPAIGAGKSQALVIRAPALGGTADSATRARIAVANLVKAGQGAPDGWKPLDPDHMPAGKVVRGEKSVSVPATASDADNAQAHSETSSADHRG